MSLKRAVNIEDLRRQAKRRLPRIVFDFIEGGSEAETGLRRNVEAFSRYRLLPRYLVDVGKCDQSARLFDRTYSKPFGFAPTGVTGIARPGSDVMLAEAAAAANIPFVISSASTAPLEELAKIAPESTWFQLYSARDMAVSEDFIRRAADAGIRTLVVTVDVTTAGKRERDIRNGWVLPYKPKLRSVLEAMLHPAWVLGYLRHGTPHLSNWIPYAKGAATAADTIAVFAANMPSISTWSHIETYRRIWPHKLVIKGIMHPEDATRAAEMGVDGIIVSNHGGRQLDRAPSPIEVLPMIRDAVGDRLVLMLDSGIRRGSDIFVALCLGARFVFVGRAAVYGAAAHGRAGADKAIEILRKEIETVQGQVGCANLSSLGPKYLLGGDFN
jgi:(S)-mandelate dehydrogenase